MLIKMFGEVILILAAALGIVQFIRWQQNVTALNERLWQEKYK